MSRKSRENKLNENMDKMNQTFENLNKNLEGVASKMESISKASKDIANTQNKITSYIDSQTEQLSRQNEAIVKRAKEDEKTRQITLNDSKQGYKKYLANQQNNYNVDKPHIRSISDFFDYRIEQKRSSYMQDAYVQAKKDAKNYIRNNKALYTDENGKYNREAYSKLQEEISGRMEDASKQFDKSVKIYKKSTDLLSSAVSGIIGVLKSIVGVYYDTAKEGLKEQSRIYEETFENISVRTGLTRNDYQDMQRKLGGFGGSLGDILQNGIVNGLIDGNSELAKAGVFDNINATEVQQMWNTLATNGFNFYDESGKLDETKLLTDSIQNIITSHVTPYLDINNQNAMILNEKLNGDFFKQIRGIGKANSEIAGNNYATQELLKTIIDQVQPMSDESLENLAQGSEEVTSFINTLIAQGYSKDAAKSYGTQLYKTQRYSNQLFRNGSLTEKMALVGAMNNGINIYDPLQFNDYLGLAVDTDQRIAGWTNGYSNTTQGVITNAVGEATGVDYERMWGAKTLTKHGTTGSTITDKTNITTEKLEELLQETTNDFVEGNNQTAKKLETNTLQNMMTDLATNYEELGLKAENIMNAVENGISTLINWLATNILGGAIGSLAGSLLGTGVGTAFGSTALASALGVTASIALPVAIATAVGKLSEYFDKKDATVKGEQWALDNYGEAGSDNPLYASLMGYTQDYKDKNGKHYLGALGSTFAYMWNTSVGRIGGGTHDTKNYLNLLHNEGYMNTKVGNNADAAVLLELAYYVASDRANQLTNLGYTHEQLEEALKLYGYDNADKLKGFLNTYLPLLEEAGYMPKTANGTQLTSKNVVNEEWLNKTYFVSKEEGHRYGLNEVPYDEYPALLHEGEAVLTASTADELRNLLDEYRNNNQSIITIDATLQNQTVQLVNKLDEVINSINNLGSGMNITSTSSIDQQQARNRLLSSMTHMTNTKDALR